MDRLFPERVKRERIIIRRQQSSPSSSPSETSPVTSPDEHSSIKSVEDSLKTEETESISSKQEIIINEIKGKQSKWYSMLINRWLILLSASIKIIIMFLVEWRYALLAILSLCLFSLYIEKSSPGVFPGISEFKLFYWLKQQIFRIFG